MRSVVGVVAVVLVVLLVLVLVGSLGMMGFGGFGMMGGRGMMGGYGLQGFPYALAPLRLIGWLVACVLVVGAIALGVGWLVTSPARAVMPGTPVRETPLDILKARYAKGEITKEQYDLMRKDLE